MIIALPFLRKQNLNPPIHRCPGCGGELQRQEKGRAFISDAVLDMTDEQVVDIARRSLAWTMVSEQKLREFLEKYGHLAPLKERLQE